MEIAQVLAEAAQAIATADHEDTRSDAIADLAQALAANDTFAANYLAYLADDTDRATTMVWDSAPELGKALAAQDRGE